MLTKIMKSSDPLSYKPQLTVLLQVLTDLRNEALQYSVQCQQYGTELAMELVCLTAAINRVGNNNDVRIDKVVHDRKMLLTNANQQAQLVVLKVQQMIDLIEQQHNQVTQLLTVTLPAYQLAKG